MNPYADVDGVIAAWVRATGSALFTEWGGEPLRYFHIPGDPPHECFQIVVFPPSDGHVAVQAAAIDTNDNTELELLKVSEGPVEELGALLTAAVATIEGWKQRNHQGS